MPYIIYKITNDIDNKLYIGCTSKPLQKRFSEHKNNASRSNLQRPLYEAMRSMGISHFQITAIEVVDTKQKADEREQFCIEHFNSTKCGYNIALGGAGKRLADYNAIYALWQQGKGSQEIQRLLSYDQHTVKIALEQFGVLPSEIKHRKDVSLGQKIQMLDLNTGAILKVFDTVGEAAKYLGKQQSGHIAAVCQGKRKQAYGYSWSYAT